jgi:hypothetical protein
MRCIEANACSSPSWTVRSSHDADNLAARRLVTAAAAADRQVTGIGRRPCQPPGIPAASGAIG